MTSESLLVHLKKYKIIIAIAALAQTWLSLLISQALVVWIAKNL